MDEYTVATSVIKPGSVVFFDGSPPHVVFREPTFKVRVTGPDLDVSLAVMCAEDIEIIERLLVKMRASLSANPPQFSTEEKLSE